MMTSVVRLRRATPADIEILAHWDTQPHVIAASGDDDAIDWSAELAAQGSVQETHRFYQRFGFVPTGEQTFGTDQCLVHRLDRTTWANTKARRSSEAS